MGTNVCGWWIMHIDYNSVEFIADYMIAITKRNERKRALKIFDNWLMDTATGNSYEKDFKILSKKIRGDKKWHKHIG